MLTRYGAIRAGVVDAIESDHAPHAEAGRQPTVRRAGAGDDPAADAHRCRRGEVELERVIAMLTTNPQRIFGVRADAETYTLADLDAAYVIDDATLRTACGWSPFAGMRVWGRVREVWIRGRLAFDGEDVLAPAGSGRNLAG